MTGENTGSIGDETAVAVLHALVEAGWSVSIPFGDNDKDDLVVDDGESLCRIRCKTAWRNRTETIRFNTYSETTKDGDDHGAPYDGGADAFIVRFPERKRLYWVDVDDATEQKIALRFDVAIDHSSVSWAADYEVRPR